MGDWLNWLVLGSLFVIMFFIYSLSNQVERCVHLAVEIIVGNQRKIMGQLHAITATMTLKTDTNSNVPHERRVQQRRCTTQPTNLHDERRASSGRRQQDQLRSIAGH